MNDSILGNDYYEEVRKRALKDVKEAKEKMNITIEKEQITKLFYTGWFSDELQELDTTKYILCPSCDGSGETDWEFPVRCFECCGNGYVTKKDFKDKKIY